MTCQFAAVNDKGHLSIYTCEQVKQLSDKWKENFRTNNATDLLAKNGIRDKAYEEFCMQIDDFIKQCDCGNTSLRCEKCSPHDHEGYFCRCEARNIRLAKQLRDQDQSIWKGKEDEKDSG